MKQTERCFFPAVFTDEQGREIAVVFPDLDVAAGGMDDDDALFSARELLGLTLLGWRRMVKRFPRLPPCPPSSWLPNGLCLYVYMPSVRMAQVSRSVNRTVTLPAWLNAAAAERNIHFSSVSQDALKTIIGISSPRS